MAFDGFAMVVRWPMTASNNNQRPSDGLLLVIVVDFLVAALGGGEGDRGREGGGGEWRRRRGLMLAFENGAGRWLRVMTYLIVDDACLGMLPIAISLVPSSESEKEE